MALCKPQLNIKRILLPLRGNGSPTAKLHHAQTSGFKPQQTTTPPRSPSRVGSTGKPDPPCAWLEPNILLVYSLGGSAELYKKAQALPVCLSSAAGTSGHRPVYRLLAKSLRETLRRARARPGDSAASQPAAQFGSALLLHRSRCRLHPGLSKSSVGWAGWPP